MNNKTIVMMVALTLCLLLLAGCEQATESTQKAVQETKDVIHNATQGR